MLITNAIPAMGNVPVEVLTVTQTLAMISNVGSEWSDIAASFGASFFAILIAGSIISLHNHKFQKEQRRREVADLFCASIERHIQNYFNDNHDGNQKEAAVALNAYIETFMLFLSDRDEIEEKTLDDKRALLNLDNEKIDKEKRLKTGLVALARIRYFLTK